MATRFCRELERVGIVQLEVDGMTFPGCRQSRQAQSPWIPAKGRRKSCFTRPRVLVIPGWQATLEECPHSSTCVLSVKDCNSCHHAIHVCRCVAASHLLTYPECNCKTADNSEWTCLWIFSLCIPPYIFLHSSLSLISISSWNFPMGINSLTCILTSSERDARTCPHLLGVLTAATSHLSAALWQHKVIVVFVGPINLSLA